MATAEMDLDTYMHERMELIDDQLKQLTAQQLPSAQVLAEAAQYALFSGGKRLRPLLLIATAEALGAPIERTLQPACALEMIHTYSLIHDDLPCMDDDDFRRGKPTLHRVYPEGTAVLTGDYLLTLAFETLAQAPDLSPAQRLDLVALFSKAAGAMGMVGGQFLDLEATGKTLSLEALNAIHAGKTGALLTAAFHAGGIVAGAAPELLSKLVIVGKQIGLAFQIIDDVLDVEQSQVKHGSQKGSDSENAKTTYATVLGVEASRAQADELLRYSLEQVGSLPGHTTALQNLMRRLVDRNL